MKRIVNLALATVVLFASQQIAHAASVNVAMTSSVINTSGTYGGLPNFPATNVIDGQGVNNTQMGTIAQDQFGDGTFGSSSYWLTQDNQGANSFFTLELAHTEAIDQFRIANTRNTQFNDRGTITFNVLASNHIDGSNNLVAPVTLLSNQTLTQPSDPNNIPFDVFNPSGTTFGNFRYIEFQTITAVGGVGNVGGNGGLNEFQVITNTPEPTSLVLGGLGAVGLLVAVRRRKKA